MIIFENDHFHLNPCYACPLPGYLILSAKDPSDTLHELPQAALSALGPTFATISRAIQIVLAPERIYTALFCEAQRGVHFHIFPRTAWLRESYLSSYSSEELLDGPRLLSWARRTFTQPIPEFDIMSINTAIREQLTMHCT
jgi:diadenosine tetraphosphate (Ap4A) HIT family hydrolase